MKKIKEGVFIDNAFISKEDMSYIEKHSRGDIYDFNVVFGFSDFGYRGNFKLLNEITGEEYIWKKGILQKIESCPSCETNGKVLLAHNDCPKCHGTGIPK